MALIRSWPLDDLMQKIQAYINHGRWIANCPQCAELGLTAAQIVQPGDVFVCSEEYSDMLAKTLVPNPRIPGAFNSVPDHVLREQAKQQAIAAGNAYEVVFPANKVRIEGELRKRPAHARNWDPATTLEELQDENNRNGVANA